MDEVKIDLEYDAILIDTSIFDGNGLRLETGLLGKLKQFKNSPIDFVIPDIIKNEILSHLEKKIKTSRNALEKAIKDASDHLFFDGSALNEAKKLLIDSDEIEHLAKSRLKNFIDITGGFILESDDFVSVGDLISRYFLNQPPFAETGKKKSEFPDAIALMAVQDWAENEGKSVIAVAKDNDWRAFCEESEYIDYSDDLSAVLSIFNQANAPFAFKDKLIESLANNTATNFLTNIESSLKGSVDGLTPDQEAESHLFWEPDGVYTRYKTFELHEDFKIVDLDEDWMVLETKATITIEAEGEFSLSVHDSIDRDYVSVGSVTATKEVEFDSELLITISGKLDGNINELFVEDVEVIETPSSIDFGSIEPDYA